MDLTSPVVFCTIAEAANGLPERAVLICDENTRQWADRLADGKPVIQIQGGEAGKTWAGVEHVLSQALHAGVDRGVTFVAVGGGVVGDLAGFAAAVYMRGVPLVQVPTSLLAMVDSAIGGKTGVDLPEGKNLAGSFWPAQEVLVCAETLETLPNREWLCGAAEVWKYGFIMDAALLDQLRQDPIRPGRPNLAQIIEGCVNHKMGVVAADPLERTGLRAILNFGHTVGHALESATAYQRWTHGEAISIGMTVEATLSEMLIGTAGGVATAVREGLQSQGLPTSVPDDIDHAELVRHMRRDKKAEAGRLAFSLLPSLGSCKLVKGIEEAVVMEALRRS